jgi:hypothetical protein
MRILVFHNTYFQRHDACHVLYVMVVRELTQSCLWIAKGRASIDQGLVVYADSVRAAADKTGMILSVWYQTSIRL